MKKWSELYKPIFPEAGNPVETSSADDVPPNGPVMETNLAGDDPVKAAQMKADQEREDALNKAKADHEALEKAMLDSMSKYSSALTDTFNEIMYGPPAKKDEGK